MPVKSNKKQVIKVLGSRLVTGIKNLTLQVQNNLMSDTPVDTGWAKANWVSSVKYPVIKDLPEFTIHERASKALLVPAAQAEQARLLAAFGAARMQYPVDMYVVNNVSYIIDLDLGSSPQAIAGFVRAAIIRAIATQARKIRQ